MSAAIDCPQCHKKSDSGARFCMHCGAGMSPQVHCPACNHLQATGFRFCMSCGSAMAGATYQGGLTDGAVVEGVWQRGPDEFIRRVLPEDCRSFLGSRVVRIPPGTVGVVVVGGRVERLLPAGEQTTMPFFERISNFFSGKGASTAFYLLDLRPIAIPFAIQTRPTENGRSVQAQILVTFQLPRGDRDAIGMFLDSVLGARSGFSAGDLYSLLRPEVTRIAGQVLESLAAAGELQYAEAESRIRQALGEQLARRYGLLLDVGVAPLSTTASLSFDLGAGEKASLFSADGEAVELDVVVRVLGQHADFAPERLQPALHSTAAAQLRAQPFSRLRSGEGLAALEDALRSDVSRELAAFGMQLVSIHVIDLRSRTGVWLLGARAELKQAAENLNIRREWLAQGEQELDLVGLSLQQTLRRQQIERKSRLDSLAAELDGAKRVDDLRRADAFSRDQSQLADREQRQELVAAQADIDVATAKVNAQRQLGLDAAARPVLETQRRIRQADELDSIRHDASKSSAAFSGRAELARKELELLQHRQEQNLAAESQQARRRAEDQAYATRQRDEAAFADVARRAQLEKELADATEARQIDKLRAMADLDMKMAEQEQTHELKLRESLRGYSEREIIAMQAAQLAKSEGGGAAWAQALSAAQANDEKEKRLDAEARHAAEVKDLLREQSGALKDVMQAELHRMAKLTEQTLAGAVERQRDAGAAALYGRSMDAMAQVAASRAAPAAAPVVANTVETAAPASAAPATACKHCTAPVRIGARFCPTCGATQGAAQDT